MTPSQDGGPEGAGGWVELPCHPVANSTLTPALCSLGAPGLAPGLCYVCWPYSPPRVGPPNKQR